MSELEEMLSRELHEVVDGLAVPSLPPLPVGSGEPRPRPALLPFVLVAAAVLLVVAGVVTVVTGLGGDREREPAHPGPTRSAPVAPVPTTPSSATYLLGPRLYVEGTAVPGDWSLVSAGERGWLGQRSDGTWWWGNGPKARAIDGVGETPPVLSPNGLYVAYLTEQDGSGLLTGFDTLPAGEGLGGVPVELGDPQDGSAVRVRAVTNDGRVVVQGTDTTLLWLPLVDTSTVDLTATAPGQQILGSTPLGLVVNDGAGGVVDGTTGAPYLAQISDAGTLARIVAVPTHDDLTVSPGGRWLVTTAAGSTGGEVTSVGSLDARRVDGSAQARLAAPDGWAFRVRAWTWEDDDYLVAPVLRTGATDGADRLARCGVAQGDCVLVDQ